MEITKRTKRTWAVSSIFYIVMGIIFCIWPEQTSNIICYIIGGCVAAFGAVFCIMYFIKRDEAFFQYNLTVGIIAVTAGVFIIVKPALILSILPACLGIAIFVSGAIKLQNAFDMQRNGFKKWWIILIFALVTIGVGLGLLISLANIATVIKSIMILLGAGLIFSGVLDIVGAVFVTVTEKRESKADEIDVEHVDTRADSDGAEEFRNI